MKQTILEAYNNIATFADEHGAAAHRQKICHAIFNDIKNIYPTFCGYVDELNLGLSGGLPFTFLGDITNKKVADIGCGAGLDSFILKNYVGDNGSVHGFDLSDKLIQRATDYASNNNINGIYFEQADALQLHVIDNTFDAITSNGVFSLIENKNQLFNELCRIANLGATFCFADIVRCADYDDATERLINEFTGCLNGIVTATDYMQYLEHAGFTNIKILQERPIELPDNIMETASLNKTKVTNLLSIITIRATKKS